MLSSFEVPLCREEILQKHRNGATARRGSFLPFDRMHRAEMEERAGTKMQQLHGKVRTTELPKNYALSMRGCVNAASWLPLATIHATYHKHLCTSE